MRDGWRGWSFHPVSDVVSTWGNNGDRGSFSRADGIAAVVHSDANRPAEGRFTSVLWSPEIDLQRTDGAVGVAFDSHYKQGQAPQTVRFVARFDGGDPVTVESFSRNRLDERVSVSVPVPAGAGRMQIGWTYADSSNNWFWMIDDVEIGETPPVDAVPRVLSATKPVATAGSTVPVRIGGLRPGQQLEAALGAGATPVPGVPVADAGGETSFPVVVPADVPPGFLALALGGEGIAAAALDITVLAPGGTPASTTEEQLWFDGFETDSWSASGGWAMSTVPQVIEQYGVDRPPVPRDGSRSLRRPAAPSTAP